MTPVHAAIQSKEEGDRLAKAAAKDAEKSDQTSAITKQYIIHATMTLVTIKWQKQWDMSEVGNTTLYNHHPHVKYKRELYHPTKKHFILVKWTQITILKAKGTLAPN